MYNVGQPNSLMCLQRVSLLFMFACFFSQSYRYRLLSPFSPSLYNLFPCSVSFGSSKGSMVETLIYETPTPLPEHAEREFAFSIGGGGGGGASAAPASVPASAAASVTSSTHYQHHHVPQQHHHHHHHHHVHNLLQQSSHQSPALDDSGIEMAEE